MKRWRSPSPQHEPWHPGKLVTMSYGSGTPLFERARKGSGPDQINQLIQSWINQAQAAYKGEGK